MTAPREIAGKYRLGEMLGKGGRGEVFRALQVDLEREVAIKLLADGADLDERERFLREAKVGAEIQHAGIAQVYDAGTTDDGTPYIAMELLEGETLSQRIARKGPLEAGDAVRIAVAICGTLEAVHKKGYLHRDIKPSNIFLAKRPDGGEEVKLIDFGIAKRVSIPEDVRKKVNTMRGLGVPPLTAADLIVGTPCYLSPEQILGDKLDARSDVYALAVTLYEMLAGTPPFGAADVGAIFDDILKGTVVKLSRRARAKKVPPALEREIDRALAKSPAERPANAAEFAAALEAAMVEPPVVEDPIVPAGVPERRPRYALAIAAALAALLMALVVLVPRGSRTVASAPTPNSVATPPAPTAESAPAPAPTAAETATPVSASAHAAPITRPRPRAASTAEHAKTPAPTPSPAPAPAPASYRIDDLKVPY